MGISRVSIRVTGEQIRRVKRVIKLEVSLKWILSLAFAISFIVRLVPELLFPVPVGFDTSIYVAGAKYDPRPRFEFRFLQKLILPYVYHRLGIDLLVFMKLYAPIIHGLITATLLLYAARVLSWDRPRLMVLMLLLSLTPAILRTSWDTHSQNLATSMLVIMLVVMGKDIKLPRLLATLPIVALISLTHQLVTVVAIAIILAELLASLKDPRKLIPVALGFIISLFIAHYLNPVLESSKVLATLKAIVTPQSRITSFTSADILLQGVVVTWYVMPAALLGIFRDRRLLIWACTTVLVFILGLFVADPRPLVPGRWITYSSIPLAFFAANSIRARGDRASLKKLISTASIILTISTGASMLFPNGTPITSAMQEVYPEIPETMASSTAKKEHIEAVIEFTTYLNRIGAEGCLVTHYPWFYWWSWYLYDGITLYNGPSYTTEQALEEIVKTKAPTCGKIYIIWFTGLTWAKEFKRSGELTLYEYELIK